MANDVQKAPARIAIHAETFISVSGRWVERAALLKRGDSPMHGLIQEIRHSAYAIVTSACSTLKSEASLFP